jgi:hypothetical protein
VLAAALHFQAEAKKDLGWPTPPRTTTRPRGEFPKGRTWNLRDAVVIDPPDLATVARTRPGRVASRAARYGFFLLEEGLEGPGRHARPGAPAAAGCSAGPGG